MDSTHKSPPSLHNVVHNVCWEWVFVDVVLPLCADWTVTQCAWRLQPLCFHSFTLWHFLNRYHEVQKQPWHPQDGGCCSQTLRAHHEVKGEFPGQLRSKRMLHPTLELIFVELASLIVPSCFSSNTLWVLSEASHQTSLSSDSLPSTGHLQHCTQHCMPTVASWLVPAGLHCIAPSTLQSWDCDADKTPQSSNTHLLVCFPLLSSVCESRQALGQLGLLRKCTPPSPSSFR